ATVTINVAPVNDAPTASNVAASGDEDAASISIVLSATDVDGSIASYTISTLPANGTLYSDIGHTTIVGAGDTVTGATLYFAPAADWNGSTSFSYTATDDGGAVSAAATASLTVNPVNDAPVAAADTGAVNEDATLSVAAINGVIQGLGTDTDLESASSALVVSGAVVGAGAVTQGVGVGTTLTGTYGTLTLNADGSYSYVADQAAADALAVGATDNDVFTYTVTDPSSALSNTATLTITVTGAIDVPIAAADVGSVAEDNPLAGNVLTNDVSEEPLAVLSVTQFTVSGVAGTFTAGDTATITGVGSLQINADGSYTFTPVLNYNGAVPVATYTITDGLGNDTSSTLSLTVTPVNDDPVSGTDKVVNVAKDGNYVITADDFGFVDTADLGDTLQAVRIDTLPGNGTLLYFNGTTWGSASSTQVVSRADIDNGFLVFKPDTGETGNPLYASFDFTVSDGAAYSTTSNTFDFNVGIELVVSDPMPVDEGKATVFVVELSEGRASSTDLLLTLGGDADAADITSVYYRVQNADNSYGAWTVLSGSGPATLAAGSTRMEVRVRTLADGVAESVESLTLMAAISGGTNTDMANTTAIGQTAISEIPSLLISGPSYISEGGEASFDLELSSIKATTTSITLSFAGVAAVGTDFEYSVDGGSTWITDATKVITMPADTSSNPTFEVLVRTLSDAFVEFDELLTVVATTSDVGVANAASDISASAYVVEPITSSTNEDTAVTLTPAGGFTYAVLGQGGYGTVTAAGGGALLYTPDPDYSGADSFRLSKTDAAGNVTTVTATVNVTAVADQPSISITVSEPSNDPVTPPTDYITNGSFETYTGGTGVDPVLLNTGTDVLTGWTYTVQANQDLELWGSGVTGISDTRALDLTSSGNKKVTLSQTITGLTNGATYTLSADLAIPTGGAGQVDIEWNGVIVGTVSSANPGELSAALANFSYTVTAGATNTLRIIGGNTSGDTDSYGVHVDNVQLVDAVTGTYTYTVNVAAALADTDNSEFLQNVVISSADVPASAVLKLSDGTVVTKSGSGPYSWTVPADQIAGLLLTVDKPASVGSFSLTATATSEESSNASTASNAASTVVAMPLDGPNDVPRIGDSDVFLTNEAGFVGSMTQTIDTYFSADGGNTFTWNPASSTLPNIYVDGQLVQISYNDATGTVTGTIDGGATTVFTVVIDMQDGASDVTYTQSVSLLGVEEVAEGGIVLPGGGNGSTLVLGFKDTSGNILYDAVLTSENVLDGTTTTVNTNNQYIGAANNLMNPGEQLTMDFATEGVTYTDGVTSRNDVASMRISFFNFDSESRIAPDELTITGYTVDGGTFSYYITNADLDADGGYTIAAPGGELIEKLIFESGSQSSFKLGVESISSVKYDADFDMQLGYQISDSDGDSDSGAITISLDGNKVMMGTAGDDVLLGGSGDDQLSAGLGSDLIVGGAGDDLLSGGLLDLASDTFRWSLTDAGTGGSPAVDTITDFDTASQASGGDVLDLRDLLSGENSGNLADYLHFEKVGSDTVLHIKSAGAAGSEDQTVLLQGVDLYAAAGVGIGAPDQDIINDLLTKGKLITD
ncbi:MAG: Ig-like domain-containing protein, partial [Sulfuritalea sp.]|nr:Ig-like domain-containing protein [Sulfuritalea sp.]